MISLSARWAWKSHTKATSGCTSMRNGWCVPESTEANLISSDIDDDEDNEDDEEEEEDEDEDEKDAPPSLSPSSPASLTSSNPLLSLDATADGGPAIAGSCTR